MVNIVLRTSRSTTHATKIFTHITSLCKHSMVTLSAETFRQPPTANNACSSDTSTEILCEGGQTDEVGTNLINDDPKEDHTNEGG